MRGRRGVTLIELIIVVVILGVLVGIGLTQFNFGGAATRQAAEVVAAAVNRARFEAIRTNQTAGIMVQAGTDGTSGTVTICRNVSESVALTCSTGAIAEVIDFNDGELARAVISNPSTMTLFFDRRGILRNPSSVDRTISIVDRSGGNLRTVTIAATGRAESN